MSAAFDKSLKGTNALVFAFGDITAASKTPADFERRRGFEIKTGVMDETIGRS